MICLNVKVRRDPDENTSSVPLACKKRQPSVDDYSSCLGASARPNDIVRVGHDISLSMAFVLLFVFHYGLTENYNTSSFTWRVVHYFF